MNHDDEPRSLRDMLLNAAGTGFIAGVLALTFAIVIAQAVAS